MAKVTIAGNAVVITSSMKLADLATIKKYRPKALRLMGGENNKEELFVVDVGNGGNGGLNGVGACFCSATHDEAKKACITIELKNVQGDVNSYQSQVSDIINGTGSNETNGLLDGLFN